MCQTPNQGFGWNANARADTSMDPLAKFDGPWSWPSDPAVQKEYRLALRVTREDVTAFRSALGKVVHVVHHCVPSINVERVETCGSAGKQTASSHGEGFRSVDIDLVVFVEGLDPSSPNIGSSISDALDAIQIAMDEQYPNTRDLHWYRKFGLRYVIKGMEIDILVGAPNVKPKDLLSISDSQHRAFLSASVSHLSKRFIGKQNILFKDMVRVVKHWRDSFGGWVPEGKPKSYLLELVMLHAFLNNGLGKPKQGTMNSTFFPYWRSTTLLIDFFRLIASVEPQSSVVHNAATLPPLFVCFERYYKRTDLPLDEPEPIFAKSRIVGKGRNKSQKTRHAVAIVMDPVNPTNNLWLTLGDRGTQLVARAKGTLRVLENNENPV
jgi:2'-5'-oligoadenylate synthetase 1, domain 2, C-terminus